MDAVCCESKDLEMVSGISVRYRNGNGNITRLAGIGYYAVMVEEEMELPSDVTLARGFAHSLHTFTRTLAMSS